MDINFDEPYACPDCELTWPHFHQIVVNDEGQECAAVVYLAEDPRAEVRDPDTGEVIFAAVKGPLRVVGGTDA